MRFCVLGPIEPWLEAFGHLVTHIPDELLSSLGPRRLGDLSRVIPEISDRSPARANESRSSDPETERYALFQAVSALLAAATSIGPVVLFLDDLHWAEKPTLFLLRHLIDRSATTPLLILVSSRDGDVRKGSPLAETPAELRREPGVERITLSGQEFDLDVLARVVGQDEDVVFAVMERAADTSLVRPMDDTWDRVSFVHALVHTASGKTWAGGRAAGCTVVLVRFSKTRAA
jgi:hypothetical protein